MAVASATSSRLSSSKASRRAVLNTRLLSGRCALPMRSRRSARVAMLSRIRSPLRKTLKFTSMRRCSSCLRSATDSPAADSSQRGSRAAARVMSVSVAVREATPWRSVSSMCKPAARPNNHQIEERVAAQAVGAVYRDARRLADGVEAGNHRVLPVRALGERLAVDVGGHAAHHVVAGGHHRNRLPNGVDVGEGLGQFHDARQALAHRFLAQMIEFEQHVIGVPLPRPGLP